jgi:hypothetical protein
LRPKGGLGKQRIRVQSRCPIVPWLRLFPRPRDRWRGSAAGGESIAGNALSRTAGKSMVSAEIDGKPGKSVASPPQRIRFVSLARKRTFE